MLDKFELKDKYLGLVVTAAVLEFVLLEQYDLNVAAMEKHHPIAVKDIEYTVEYGVTFVVVHSDGKEVDCSLPYDTVKRIEEIRMLHDISQKIEENEEIEEIRIIGEDVHRWDTLNTTPF